MNVGATIEELVRKRKDLTNKKFSTLIGVSEPTLYKMFKSKDGDKISVAVAKRICDILNVSYEFLFEGEESLETNRQTATGIGNAVGDGNKSKVQIGKRLSGRQEVYGMGIDEMYVKLLTCEKDREKDREVFSTKIEGLEGLLAAKDEMIQMLRQR